MIVLYILISVIDRLFDIFYYLLLARVLISWFPNIDRTHPIVIFLYRTTEPVLQPVRRILPPGSMIDFSPLIVFLLLPIVKRFVFQLLLLFA